MPNPYLYFNSSPEVIRAAVNNVIKGKTVPPGTKPLSDDDNDLSTDVAQPVFSHPQSAGVLPRLGGLLA